MANPRHLEILKQEVAAWNRWREENRFDMDRLFEEIDLGGANLDGADLAGANLSNADLRRAKPVA